MTELDPLTRFESRLLDDLKAYQGRLEPVPQVQAPRSRRRAVRVGVALVVLVGAAAAAFGFLGLGGHHEATASAAEITRRTLTALADSRDLIRHQKTTGHNGDSSLTKTEAWYDLTAHRYRIVVYGQNGAVVSGSLSTIADGKLTAQSVDYQKRTWRTITGTVPTSSAAAGSPGYAEQIREQVSSGVYVLLGTDSINGKKVLHLRKPIGPPELSMRAVSPSGVTMPAPARAHFPNELHMWVDPSTYLPVRSELTSPSGVRLEVDYDWLPRTPENLGKLELVVPPGFNHTSETVHIDAVRIGIG
jgi:hypothetical protein